MKSPVQSNRWIRPAAVLAFGCLLWAAAGAPSPAFAQEFPPRPDRSVNDFAGILRAGDASALEALNREVLAKSGVAIVVAVLPDIGGAPIEDYANRLGRAWGIGDGETDRGILFLVAVQERRVRIETGYGVEGYLPDGKVGAMLDRYVLPAFRRGDFSAGIRRGNEALAALTAEEFGFELTGGVRPEPSGDRPRGRPGGILGGLFSLFLLLAFIIFAIRHPFLALFLLSILGGGRGGRGGFGGGGFGGGGFGGFGGGSFGGGGASRGW